MMAETTLLAKEDELRSKPPYWTACSPQWDETGEKVKVYISKMNRLVTATLHMFVYVMTFSWGYATGEMGTIRCVIPPIPVSATTAEHLWDAMRTQPWSKPLHRFKLSELNIADENCSLDSAQVLWHGQAHKHIAKEYQNARFL